MTAWQLLTAIRLFRRFLLSAYDFSRNRPQSRLFCGHHVSDQGAKKVALMPQFIQRHSFNLPV